MHGPTDPIPVDYYVYYRVHDVAEAIPRIREMQAELGVRTGIHGHLMRREDDDEATLMEVYPAVVETALFEAALESVVTGHAIDRMLAEGTARHVERFICA